MTSGGTLRAASARTVARVTLSLTGSGHLLVYQLGALQSIVLRQQPHATTNSSSSRSSSTQNQQHQQPKFVVDHVVGASGGAIAAFCMAAMPDRMADYADAFIEQRGKGMQLLRDFYYKNGDKLSSNTSLPLVVSPMLHIATTRCSDGSSKIFSFDNASLQQQRRAGNYNQEQANQQDDQGNSTTTTTTSTSSMIFDCLAASCLIPPSFHPLDIVSSPSPYPEHEGIPIYDDKDGTYEYYVDGGISTPAPMIFLDGGGGGGPDQYDCYDSEQRATEQQQQQQHRIIISPVAGTSPSPTLRISPRPRMWRPEIHVPHDMGIQMTWDNLRALQATTGNVTSNELQDWYQRGQEDGDRFLASFRPEE